MQRVLHFSAFHYYFRVFLSEVLLFVSGGGVVSTTSGSLYCRSSSLSHGPSSGASSSGSSQGRENLSGDLKQCFPQD